MTINDIHSLIAPYALDALDADERARFEAHLEECAECRAELAGFLETASRLGEVSSMAPPAELKERLMVSVARTRQERPIVTALSGRGRLRRSLPRLAAAVACIVAIAGFAAFGIERHHNSDLRAEQRVMNHVLTAPDAHMSGASLKSGGTIRMIASKSRDSVVVVASDLPALHRKTYQLWTIHKGQATSAGLLGGHSSIKLLRGMKGAESLAITIEPAGGSKAPTTAPIAAMGI